MTGSAHENEGSFKFLNLQTPGFFTFSTYKQGYQNRTVPITHISKILTPYPVYVTPTPIYQEVYLKYLSN